MRNTRYRMLAAAALVAIGAVAGGATPAGGLSPSVSVTTAIIGWEQWVRLEWSAEPRQGGQVIEGWVHNKYGQALDGVQILAQGLDASGNLVDQKLSWVHGMVPGLQRAYFKVPALRPAARYQVSVWAFNIVDSKAFP